MIDSLYIAWRYIRFYRVRTAIRNSGYRMPGRRTVVGLSPADLRKQGPAYDLPMALGILAATGRTLTIQASPNGPTSCRTLRKKSGRAPPPPRTKT